jgi:RimJ/RimL family protein N-acetyltransferase
VKRFLYRLRTLRATVKALYGGGPGGYLRLVWYHLLRPNRFLILAAEPHSMSAEPSPGKGHDFRWIEPAQLELLRAGMRWPREFYMDRTSKPSRCCLGMVNGEPAYVHWIFMQGDGSRFLRIGEGAAEINYILTLPAYRGLGLCGEAIRFTMRELGAEGIDTVYAVVHDGNVASLKALSRAGMHETGAIRAIGPLNRKREVGGAPSRPAASGEDR